MQLLRDGHRHRDEKIKGEGIRVRACAFVRVTKCARLRVSACVRVCAHVHAHGCVCVSFAQCVRGIQSMLDVIHDNDNDTLT